jgi:hypothetical protein
MPAPTTPRPTRAAFQPATRSDLQSDLALAGVCLAGFIVGLLANIFGDFLGFAQASERSGGNTLTPLWLQLLVYFGFPLFLAGTAYFLWHAWNAHRRTSAFRRRRASATATLTHLWKEPPSGSGKKYYAGYQFGAAQSAYQQVDARLYKRLALGQELPVEYLPDDPAVSCLVFKK